MTDPHHIEVPVPEEAIKAGQNVHVAGGGPAEVVQAAAPFIAAKAVEEKERTILDVNAKLTVRAEKAEQRATEHRQRAEKAERERDQAVAKAVEEPLKEGRFQGYTRDQVIERLERQLGEVHREANEAREAAEKETAELVRAARGCLPENDDLHTPGYREVPGSRLRALADALDALAPAVHEEGMVPKQCADDLFDQFMGQQQRAIDAERERDQAAEKERERLREALLNDPELDRMGTAVAERILGRGMADGTPEEEAYFSEVAEAAEREAGKMIEAALDEKGDGDGDHS